MQKLSFLIMPLTISLCFSSLMCATTKQKTVGKFKITGVVMQTMSYCGGAQPTRQILDSFNTPRALPFKKLFIKVGKSNKEGTSFIDSVISDGNGRFSVDLQRGNYCVVEEWKSKPFQLPLKKENETLDSVCFRNLYDSCDYQFTVSDKNIENIKIIFHSPCFYNQPCRSYHGALPPQQHR
jgi:hypothetical protein